MILVSEHYDAERLLQRVYKQLHDLATFSDGNVDVNEICHVVETIEVNRPRNEDTVEGGDGAPDNGSQSRVSAASEQETSKAETLEDLRIPEDGSINTLIGKLVAHYLSEDDSPEDVDAHRETYNAAIDHVEDVVRRRKQRVLEAGEMPEERKVVRVDELNALLGDVRQKGGME